MPPDPETPLPEPPSPRPAARDAAIEAAMRRFDGADEPAAATPRPTPWTRRPQFQLAVAASLVLAVGLPAALIGLRQQEAGPGAASAPAQEPSTQYEPDQAARVAQAPASEESQSVVAPPPGAAPPVTAPKDVTPPVVSAQQSIPAAPPASERESADALAPPPPPPPPPPAPALAQKSTEGMNDVVVTGTRIRQPNLESPSPVTVVDGKASERDEIAAKDFTKKDRAYGSFLRQLQAAVRDNDSDSVVRLIGFPLRVNAGARSQTYPDASSVRRDYDSIFTPHVRQAILAQRADRLFQRDLGVMIGNGEVWFDHTCLDQSCARLGPVRITAINR